MRWKVSVCKSTLDGLKIQQSYKKGVRLKRIIYNGTTAHMHIESLLLFQRRRQLLFFPRNPWQCGKNVIHTHSRCRSVGKVLELSLIEQSLLKPLIVAEFSEQWYFRQLESENEMRESSIQHVSRNPCTRQPRAQSRHDSTSSQRPFSFFFSSLQRPFQFFFVRGTVIGPLLV